MAGTTVRYSNFSKRRKRKTLPELIEELLQDDSLQRIAVLASWPPEEFEPDSLLGQIKTPSK
jgi:hypothetical protein